MSYAIESAMEMICIKEKCQMNEGHKGQSINQYNQSFIVYKG